MSEYTISPIASLDASPAQATQVPTTTTQMEQANVERTAKVAAEKQLAPKSAAEKSAPSKAQYSDVHMKFQVDDDTNEITVLILDKNTEEVIRTIPPEELSNLRAGDLFELFM